MVVLLLGGGAALAREGGDVVLAAADCSDPANVGLEACALPEPEVEPEPDPEPEAEREADSEPEAGPDCSDPANADLETCAVPAVEAEPEPEPVAVAEDVDERSETATRVHRASSGDPAVGPGHPDFGCSVSARARSGGLGTLVSRAARGEEIGEDELALGGVGCDRSTEAETHPSESRGPGRGTGAPAPDETAGTDAEVAGEDRAAERPGSGNGRPAWAGPGGRGPDR